MPSASFGFQERVCDTARAAIRARIHTTWTVLRHDGPDHLGLWCNALPRIQTARLTSDRGAPNAQTGWRPCRSSSSARAARCSRTPPVTARQHTRQINTPLWRSQCSLREGITFHDKTPTNPPPSLLCAAVSPQPSGVPSAHGQAPGATRILPRSNFYRAFRRLMCCALACVGWASGGGGAQAIRTSTTFPPPRGRSRTIRSSSR